jgi:hypothetical protein
MSSSAYEAAIGLIEPVKPPKPGIVLRTIKVTAVSLFYHGRTYTYGDKITMLERDANIFVAGHPSGVTPVPFEDTISIGRTAVLHALSDDGKRYEKIIVKRHPGPKPSSIMAEFIPGDPDMSMLPKDPPKREVLDKHEADRRADERAEKRRAKERRAALAYHQRMVAFHTEQAKKFADAK